MRNFSISTGPATSSVISTEAPINLVISTGPATNSVISTEAPINLVISTEGALLRRSGETPVFRAATEAR